MTKIAAFSKKFPPSFKRRWYVVKSGRGFRIRFLGSSLGKYFPSLNVTLDIMEELTALHDLGLKLELFNVEKEAKDIGVTEFGNT